MCKGYSTTSLCTAITPVSSTSTELVPNTEYSEHIVFVYSVQYAYLHRISVSFSLSPPDSLCMHLARIGFLAH